MKAIVFTTSAADQLLSLPQGAQDAIEQALDDYAIAGSGMSLRSETALTDGFAWADIA